MKLALYVVAAIGIVLGVIITFTGFGIFQSTAGLVLLLVGTSSLGFAVVLGRLDKLARLTESGHPR